MSDKRFERWNDHSCKVKDNQEGILLNWEDVANKLNKQQDIIGEQKIAIDELITDYKKLEKENEQLKEENEQLRLELETHKNPLWSTREAERKVNKLSGSLADEVKKNGLLNEELNQLRIENERLKSRNNYNLEDCLLEIVELKEEKEQLKKKLESLQKVLHLVECVSDE